MRALELLMRRLMQALALALGVGTLCLLMMRALPGDMALRVAAGRYGFDRVDNAAADAVRAELGWTAHCGRCCRAGGSIC